MSAPNKYQQESIKLITKYQSFLPSKSKAEKVTLKNIIESLIEKVNK